MSLYHQNRRKKIGPGPPSGGGGGFSGMVGSGSGNITLTDGTYAGDTAVGTGFVGSSDNYTYYALNQQVAGDFEFIGKAVSQAGDSGHRFGLLATVSFDADAKRIGFFRRGFNNSRANIRTTQGGSSAFGTESAATGLPIWHKIARVGSDVTVETSTDGITYTVLDTFASFGTDTLELAIAGNANSTSTWDSVSVTGGTGGGGPAAGPTGLSVSNIAETSADLSWAALSGATSYTIEGRVSGGSFSVWGTTASTSFSATGLTGSTTYNWRVKAVVSSEDTAYSTGPNFSTLAGAGGGDGPSGLGVGSISDSSATFSWSSLSGATSYTVEAKPQSASTYSALGTTASTSFTSNALTAGTDYDWRVRAVVSGQNTNYSTGPQFSTTGAASSNTPYLMLPHPFYSELEVDHTLTEIRLEFKDPIKFGGSPSITLKNFGGSTIKTFSSGERSIEGHWNHILKLTGVSLSQNETYSLVVTSGSIQDSASSTNWPGLSQNEYVFTTTKSSYNEIYVSPSGNDSNSGLTSGSPKLTLQGAWAIAGADSRINLAAGVYRQVDVTLSAKTNHRNPIIIKGAGKSQTFIRGSQVLTGWTNVSGSKWKTSLSASGFNSQQCWRNGVHLTQWGANVSRYNSGSESYLDDQGTNENDMIAGSFYHKASTNEIFVWLSDSSNPNNSLMEASRATWVLETKNVEGLVMKDLTIEHDGNDWRVQCGIIKPGARQKFTNLNIRYGSFQNFRITSGEPYLQVEYCDISWAGNVGLDANNGSVTTGTQRNYFSFNNNTVHNNNYRDFYYAWHSGGFKMIPGMFHVMVWDNTFYENHGPNIWFDHPMGENLVQGNRVTAHTDDTKLGQGIFYEVSENLIGNWGVVIRNNLVDSSHRQGIYISASEEAEVYNNTVTASWCPLALHGMPRQDTNKDPVIVYQLNDNNVYNNILENKTGAVGTYTVIYIGNDNNGVPVSGNAVNSNFYNTSYSGSTGTATLAIVSSSGYGATDFGVGSGSTACGKGYECDGLNGDAQFVDRVDFELQPGSPAAGKGYLG